MFGDLSDWGSDEAVQMREGSRDNAESEIVESNWKSHYDSNYFK